MPAFQVADFLFDYKKRAGADRKTVVAEVTRDLVQLADKVKRCPDNIKLSSSRASACQRLLQDANEEGFAGLGGKLLFAAILIDDLILVKSILRLMNVWMGRGRGI